MAADCLAGRARSRYRAGSRSLCTWCCCLSPGVSVWRWGWDPRQDRTSPPGRSWGESRPPPRVRLSTSRSKPGAAGNDGGSELSSKPAWMSLLSCFLAFILASSSGVYRGWLVGWERNDRVLLTLLFFLLTAALVSAWEPSGISSRHTESVSDLNNTVPLWLLSGFRPTCSAEASLAPCSWSPP